MLPKQLSQETIHKPGGSVEALKKPQLILTSLQAVHNTLKNMEDPQDQRARQSALFYFSKSDKRRIVPEEAKRLRYMVLIHLVKL